MNNLVSAVFAWLAAVMVLAVIYALWQSLRAALGATGAHAGLSSITSDKRAAMLDEKHAVLRAIKDLEYERAVGKISDDDFTQLDAMYRARARETLRALETEDSAYVLEAERLITEREKKAKPSSEPQA